jgi:hypothetical protein
MLNYGFPIPPGEFIEHGQVGISFAVKRDVLLANPFPPPPSEDFKFLHMVQERGFKITYTNTCGYIVRKFLTDPDYKPMEL